MVTFTEQIFDGKLEFLCSGKNFSSKSGLKLAVYSEPCEPSEIEVFSKKVIQAFNYFQKTAYLTQMFVRVLKTPMNLMKTFKRL